MSPLRFTTPTALAILLGAACTTTDSARSDTATEAARTRDEAACLKMCEVAGDAEQSPEAVSACQKDCTTASSGQ